MLFPTQLESPSNSSGALSCGRNNLMLQQNLSQTTSPKVLHHLHLGPLALYDLDLVLGCLGTSSHLLGLHPLLLYKQIHLVAFPLGFVQLKVSHCNFVYFVCVQRPDQDRLRIPTFINTSYILAIFGLLLSYSCLFFDCLQEQTFVVRLIVLRRDQ